MRPVRRIFEVIDAYGELDDDDDAMLVDTINISAGNDTGSQDGSGDIVMDQRSSSSEKRLSILRYRMAPLIAVEASLADRLAGGQSTSAKGNLFVRSGWQARSLLAKAKLKDRTSFTGKHSSLENVSPSRRSEDSGTLVGSEKDKLVEEVATILNACKEDIKELWEHSVVQRLRDKRRLRLEEWAELYVVCLTTCLSRSLIVIATVFWTT